jgi:O-antigen ligase
MGALGLPKDWRGAQFDLPRRLRLAYAVLALALSVVLVSLSIRRGGAELAWWLAAYGLVAAAAWRWPNHGVLVAGWGAFVLGFARTWRHGWNLDLGLSLLLLALALFLLRSPSCTGRLRLDWGGLLLAAVAVFALVSLAFAVARIHAFRPAPGFGYHAYRFNAYGLSSEEAIVRVLLNAAITFAWFGCYVFARTVRVPRRLLGLAVFSALLLNSAALLVQARVSPSFLHPAGWRFYDRGNGVTSFCWALGDAALAFFLLLPLWGSRRGRSALLTIASLTLLLHAVAASGSRTALGVMLAAVLLWGALRVLRLRSSGRGAVAALVAGAALVLVAGMGLAYWLAPADNSTPLGRLKEGIERQGLLGHLVAVRLGSYPLALRIVQSYPLTGIGAGLYPVEVEKYRALLLPDSRSLDPFLLTSYLPNQLLNIAAELGLPSVLCVVGTLGFGIWSGLRRFRDPRAGDLGASALVLLAALQLGPSFYNSEALLFAWLVIGGAVGAAERAGDASPGSVVEAAGAETGLGGSRWRSRDGRAVPRGLAAALALALAGQLAARSSLAVERQWQQLRWRMNMGLYPSQEDGQWTAPEATLSTDIATPAVLVRWHAGDRQAHRYVTSVSFFVDGAHVVTTTARSGAVRETWLPLPLASGFKRISVRVDPPFVPARELGGSDDRPLGIFVHSLTPRLAQ